MAPLMPSGEGEMSSRKILTSRVDAEILFGFIDMVSDLESTKENLVNLNTGGR